MTQQGLPDLLRAARIIPVLTIADAAQAVPLARALVAGGIRTLEITLRTAAGADAAAAIMAEVPDAIVGLGTVLTPDDLARAESLGVAFAVSPGSPPALLAAAAASRIPFMPGIATASEAMAAIAAGFPCMKLFPARELGGLAALRALAGPFPDARFCPTGGITAENAATYLAEPNVLAIGGSWLAPTPAVASNDWPGITARARQAASV